MDRSGHSPLGISSFCVSVFSSLLLFFWLLMAGADGDETLIGLTMFFQVFVSVVGTGLGIAPLFSSSKKRGFAIAGVVVGVATFVVSIGVLGLGLWAMSSGLVE